ncbi:MAG: ImmA/IrrE family metallo-endopeptidase [Pseudomonadota bacterium]
MLRVEVQPTLLQWARGRAGLSMDALVKKFPRLDAWESGEQQPTLKQLESYAATTRTPIGYLFLTEPPVEAVPIPDLRTMGNQRLGRPSPDLLETIYLCQQRQEWYRDNSISLHEPTLPFVGSVTLQDPVEQVAASMRSVVGLDLDARRRLPTWIEALRRSIEVADDAGVLVMVSGVVGSNNQRKLDPQEFRGFALSDPVAPLVFINGSDTKAAQMFTLAHELAHVWLGHTALSDASVTGGTTSDVETWCNRVAAEFLVPLDSMREAHDPRIELEEEMTNLARRFKVSTLVILGRLRDGGWLSTRQFVQEYERELQRLLAVKRKSGGTFYLTLGSRVSKRFARALIVSTLEGRTTYTQSFRMLGLSKAATFNELSRRLGLEF